MTDPTPLPDGTPVEVTPLIFRLADSTVLIGVRATDRGPQPLVTDVAGQPCAVAYTDPEELRRDLPDGYHLYQIPVPLLLNQLPPGCGLVINPQAASPLYIAADERQTVLAASVPFPADAFIKIKAGGDQQPALLAAVLPRIDVTPVRRVFITRYQVADAREKVLVAYETDPVPGADDLAADAFMSAAADTRLSDPMQIVALADIPEPFRHIILDDVAPAYVRPDLVD
jgi:hypothetical protein